jgi:hypothetical protein
MPVFPGIKQLTFQPMAARDGPVATSHCLLKDSKEGLSVIFTSNHASQDHLLPLWWSGKGGNAAAKRQICAAIKGQRLPICRRVDIYPFPLKLGLPMDLKMAEKMK